MTDRYVYSGAGGAGTGVDWANAFTTLTAAFAAGAAGDRFFVAHDHSTSTAGAVTLTSPGTSANPCQVICVNRVGSVPPVAADLRTTAAIAATGANSVTTAGSAYWYGMVLTGGSGAVTNGVVLGTTAGAVNVFENCTIVKGGTSANNNGIDINSVTNGGYCELINTTMQFGATGDSVRGRGTTIWRNTPAAIAGATIPTTLFGAAVGSGTTVCEGVDLSAITGTLVGDNSAVRRIFFKDCKLAANVTIAAAMTQGTQEVVVSRSDSLGSNYRSERHSLRGSQTVELTRIRTGGAHDGVTALAWKAVTNANALLATPFRTMPMAIRNSVTGTSQTVTVYGIINAAVTPKNDEIWIDVEHLGETTSPRGFFSTGRKATLLSTAADVEGDTQAWDSAATERANSAVYSLGDVIKVAAAPNQLFFCTTAGTTASSVPGDYTGLADGLTVADGTAVFRAGIRFRLTATITPQQRGLVYVGVSVAKASTTYFVDPKPTITTTT